MFKYKSFKVFVFLFLIVIGSFFVKSSPAHAICNYIESDPGSAPNITAYSVSPTVVTGNSLVGSMTFVSGGRCELNGMIHDGTPSMSAGPFGTTGPDWLGPGSHTFSYTFDVSSLANGTYTAYFDVDSIYGFAPQRSTTFTIARTLPPPTNFTVSATAGAGGSIVNTPSDPNPKTSITAGSTTSFTTTPSSGYTVDSNVVSSAPTNCIPGGFSANTYTTGTINANCTYTFSFSPLQMSGTLTPASQTCKIPAGGSSCTASLNWSITNPEASITAITTAGKPDVNVSTSKTPSNQSGAQTVSATYNNNNPVFFFLYNNGVNVSSAQATITPSCDVGTAWNTGTNTCKTISTPINGACGAYHYLCAPGGGTSSNNVDGASAWTWDCLGSNGGSNASCSETKSTACAYPPCAVPPTLPTVTTSTPTNITANDAAGGGNTTSDGGSTVTQAGVVWSTMANPTKLVNGGITYDGWAIGGPWASNITGLFSSTTYHVRAYATNSVGTSYGSDVTFTTPSSLSMTGTLTSQNSSCVIASGASNCNVNLNWSIKNPQATPTAITATGMSNINVSNTLATPQSGTQSAPVSYSNRTFYLYNNAALLAQTTVYASCITGTGWDPVSKTCKVGAPSCANGAVNYPACTVDAGNNCLNGASDPTACLNVVNGGGHGSVNGTCAKTHYSCTTGTSGSNVNTPSAWNWSCNGTGGGSSASCTELKKKPKFIEN